MGLTTGWGGPRGGKVIGRNFCVLLCIGKAPLGRGMLQHQYQMKLGLSLLLLTG